MRLRDSNMAFGRYDTLGGCLKILQNLVVKQSFHEGVDLALSLAFSGVTRSLVNTFAGYQFASSSRAIRERHIRPNLFPIYPSCPGLALALVFRDSLFETQTCCELFLELWV